MMAVRARLAHQLRFGLGDLRPSAHRHAAPRQRVDPLRHVARVDLAALERRRDLPALRPVDRCRAPLIGYQIAPPLFFLYFHWFAPASRPILPGGSNYSLFTKGAAPPTLRASPGW